MKNGLIIIDIQNDYFPGGNMTLEKAEEAAVQAGILLQGARNNNTPVFHVQHLAARSNASFFLPGTWGAEIHTMVLPQAGEEIVRKNFPNSFRNTNLHRTLSEQGIDHLIICGMMTHMCIDATVRAAADLGFRCTLAADACATRDLIWNDQIITAKDVQGAFLAALSGLYAEITTTSKILKNFLS